MSEFVIWSSCYKSQRTRTHMLNHTVHLKTQQRCLWCVLLHSCFLLKLSYICSALTDWASSSSHIPLSRQGCREKLQVKIIKYVDAFQHTRSETLMQAGVFEITKASSSLPWWMAGLIFAESSLGWAFPWNGCVVIKMITAVWMPWTEITSSSRRPRKWNSAAYRESRGSSDTLSPLNIYYVYNTGNKLCCRDL